jgi:hypothetical protein
VHTSQQASTREVCWRILPVTTPRVLRHCSHCGTTRQFACSDTFRVNANQRKIDVWLIYRCVDCDCTWNRTIFTRSTPEEIGLVLYRHFQDNHRETAWHYTFDLAQLHRLGVRCDATVPVRVSGPPAKRVACWVGPSQRRLVAVKISPPDHRPPVRGYTASPLLTHSPPSIPHSPAPRNVLP